MPGPRASMCWPAAVQAYLHAGLPSLWPTGLSLCGFGSTASRARGIAQQTRHNEEARFVVSRRRTKLSKAKTWLYDAQLI